MASLNQLVSEFAHAVGNPNSIPLRRNLRYAILHGRNELIRKSYENHKYVDKEEAEIYKIRGLKYDGIPYVVYKTNKEFYEIQLINNGTHSYSAIKFKYANYINRELRGKDAKQLNSECKTVDDIFNLKLGLRN
jgi:hypothetical protein